MESRYQFDDVPLLSAVAMGVPGKRTFFLIIGQKDKWLRVWLEKYVLESLALAIDQYLSTLSKEHLNLERGTTDMLQSGTPSGFPSVELEVDEITMGYDSGSAILDLQVHGVGPKAQERSEVNCRLNRTQLEKLADKAKSLCAAGRPICSICGNPIDPSGHDCPGGN